MRQSFLAFTLGAFVCFTLAACGSSSSSTQTTSNPPPAGAVPTSISIHDNPPSGVTILQFELQVTAATLQPATAGQPPVPMLTGPQEVELEHLQTESALLANTMVPPGPYSGLSVTFASPQMTIFNQSNQTLTVGGQNCPSMQICELTPTLNQMMVTIQAPTAPFPVTLSAESPLAFLLHFDVNASVQGDLSITPMVDLTQLPLNPQAVPEHEHVTGIVTAVSSPNFTLLAGPGAQSLNITTDGNTMYRFDGSCPADNFSCIAVGQVLRVKLNVMSGGGLDATQVRMLEPQGHPAFEGIIVATNAAQDQFQIVVNDRQCDDPRCQSVSVGAPVTVQLSPSSTFSIDTDGITLPSGLTFATVQDLVIGQVVEFQPQLPVTVTGTPPNVQITANASSVQLEPSQITATVSAVNAMAAPPNFILNGLPPLFTGGGITMIQVDTVSGTDFENVNGIGALAPGQTVSVAGLLFNTATQPTVVASEVKLRHQDD
ncbi:MAG TPA: DUF5666 domain-containing protein [Candidatus Acidoferrales bacterium]|nr:DUF5666 domain-containing protein [Candidatus Acidoferrales bacterium]